MDRWGLVGGFTSWAACARWPFLASGAALTLASGLAALGLITGNLSCVEDCYGLVDELIDLGLLFKLAFKVSDLSFEKGDFFIA
jgi:hypothetical protein